MDYTPPSRSERTLEFSHNLLLLNLAQLFKGFFPGETNDDFFRTILGPLRVLGIGGDQKLAEAHVVRYIQKYEFFLIACAYWVELDLALRKGERETAWSFCMDASYYCAAAKTISETAEVNPADVTDQLEEARSELGKLAARAKDKPWEIVRAKAVELIDGLGSAGKTWPSYRQMATAIRDEVLGFAAAHGVTMSVDRATTTISEYLKEAEHLQAFIRKKTTTPAGTR
jgi:hypothetical protein